MTDPKDPKKDLPVPQVYYLKDYCPPSYLIPIIELTIILDPKKTWVRSKLYFQKNPSVIETCHELFLNGEELELKSLLIDGKKSHDYRLEEDGLTLLIPKNSFILETEVIIYPETNTRLEGLYLSGEIFCTQCEAEGFRRITYTLDRPDVLSTFIVTLIADGKRYPTLLSNGNHDLEKSGVEADGKLREVFIDPFPKPSYLFAIVAGKMDKLEDSFVSLSNRQIHLTIYSEPGKINKCYFAMEALKASMKWEEKVYGLEYDLDDYKIVAVDSFNLGAMENKGLNIFNSSLIFYDEKTATDADREQIAVTIAHEYFHNWTGNRVTLRDWFQLTLKEGLTVYRDRCFRADYYSSVVVRIRNAKTLRSLQFPEDSGPLSHPIQPYTYKSINNLYTLTVYEKGAEVVGMYEYILGKRKFIHGVKQYLHYFDGQASTVEDFFASMQALTQQDLSQFMRWYHTPGTPIIKVQTNYQAQKKTYQVKLSQSILQKTGIYDIEPLLIPLAYSVNVKKGDQVISTYHGLWLLKDREETRTFTDIETPPRLSLNENFSAPVKVFRDFELKDWIEQFYYEQNPFLKWDALQQCYLFLCKERIESPLMDIEKPVQQLFEVIQPILEPILTSFKNKKPNHFLEYGNIDHHYYGDCSFLAQLLKFPSFTELMEFISEINFTAIKLFVDDFRKSFVQESRGVLEKIYTTLYQIHSLENNEVHLDQNQPFPSSMGSNHTINPIKRGKRNLSGERELKNTCLDLLSDNGRQDWALNQFYSAQGSDQKKPNFNDEFMALKCILLYPNIKSEEASQIFYERWRNDNLVINRWFGTQAEIKNNTTLKKIIELQNFPEFNLKEPNKCRSLFRNFIRNNPFIFNHHSGEGYRIIADVIIRLDHINPISASDLLVYWPSLKKLMEPQKSLMLWELKRIQKLTKSKDVSEIIEKRLNL